MSTSPTQRSLAYLRKQGYRAQVVEHWVPHANKRRDLFGIIDIVALKDGETVGVQTTSYANVSARVNKIAAADALADLRKAGWSLLVHGWRKTLVKRGGKRVHWVVREVDVS